jgi:hypothetical protein
MRLVPVALGEDELRSLFFDHVVDGQDERVGKVGDVDFGDRFLGSIQLKHFGRNFYGKSQIW